jgi:regulator of protease activity HflC (stomatin/prohibitin superfamily)
VGTFCCLTAAWVLLLLLGRALSLLAWSDNYENYSFLLDHLAIITRFFSGIVLIFLAAAALRAALDFMFKKVSSPGFSGGGENSNEAKNSIEDGTLAYRRTALTKFCGTLIHILGAVYVIGLGFWLFLFGRRNLTQYSPPQFYRYYREEVFHYSPAAFLAVLGLGIGAVILSILFKRQKLLKTVSCAGVFHNMFQTLGGMGLCAAAAAGAGYRAGPVLTFIAEWFITGGCLYFTAGLLRGLGRDMLRGDMTGAFPYKPLVYLPETIKFFDRTVSLEERTGLSFKTLWRLKYAAKMLPPVILAGCAMLFLFTSMYTIEPHQEALLYHLGSLRAGSVKSPGLHFKLPWPIDDVNIYDVSRVRNMRIGYVPSTSQNYLWDSEHGGSEYTLLLGGGSEMLAVNMRISYRISNLYDYIIRYANGEDFLASGMYAILMRETVSSDLNTMFSVDRKILSEELTAGLSDYADNFNLGIHVNEVIIENIHPPIELAEVYHGVIDSAIQKETITTQALADAEKTINDALRQKEASILTALTRQTEKTSMAHREMAVYESAFLAHDLAPESYKLNRTTNFYRHLIQKEHLYVFSPDTTRDMDRYVIVNGFNSVITEQEL